MTHSIMSEDQDKELLDKIRLGLRPPKITIDCDDGQHKKLSVEAEQAAKKERLKELIDNIDEMAGRADHI